MLVTLVTLVTLFENQNRANAVGKWLSLVEHSVRDAGVGGSNPLFPTIKLERDFR